MWGQRNHSGQTRLIQLAIPDYRVPVVEQLASALPEGLEVDCSRVYFDATIESAPEILTKYGIRRVRYLAGRKVAWQSLDWRAVISAPVVFVELNPRILSTWFVLLARAAARRPTVAWGHAWTRRSDAALGDLPRRAFRALASHVVVYTEKQAAELRATSRRPEKISAAPNSIYLASEMVAAEVDQAQVPISFVYVGRLVESKKPALMLDAFARASASSQGAELVIAGDGPLRADLEARAEALGIRARFLGHVADAAVLRREVYGPAIASISPGYVGLSLTQSLGFGVPMIIAAGEPHSPEIEAAIEGHTAFFFAHDDPQSMAQVMDSLWAARHELATRRVELSKWTRDRYSIERLVAGLIEADRTARNESRLP